jgi:hypothetical protein
MKARGVVRTPPLVILAVAGFFSLAWSGHAVARAQTGPAPNEPTLAEVRAATERFRDVKVALAEGYMRDPFDLCDTAEMMGRPAALGAMGVHYFRPDLLGITAPPAPRVDGVGIHTDFADRASSSTNRRRTVLSNSWPSRTSCSSEAGARKGSPPRPRFTAYPTT